MIMKVTKEEFDESCNDEPEFIIGKDPVGLDQEEYLRRRRNDERPYNVKEPVDDYEISQHSADEVCQDDKKFLADYDKHQESIKAEELGGWTKESLRGLKVSEPEDVPMPICWRVGDECIVNNETFKIQAIKVLYLIESLSGKYPRACYYEEMQRPEELSDRDKSISKALDLFSMLDAPSPDQLGVLYDQGLLTK